MNKFERVKDMMVEQNTNQMVVCNPFDIFYLTGILIDPGDRFFCLYIKSDNEKIDCKMFVNKIFNVKPLDKFEIVYHSDDQKLTEVLHDFSKIISEETTLLIDKNFPARFLLPLINFSNTKDYSISNVMEQTRIIKSHEEINLMRESSKLNDLAMEKLVNYIHENQTEIELADSLRQIKKDLGVENYSFEPIIAFGKNAAEPHHVPNDTKLKTGDCIVIDIGFIKDNYCSDMTRTFFYKTASEFDKKIYNIVLNANLKAIEKVKPNATFAQIDLAARDYIKSEGYDDKFMHTTGHSIGLQCHEFGTVTYRNNDIIKPGMIFSIEPGIYLKDKLGVRIEDLVLVTEDGYELLNKYDKRLNIIG